LLRGQVHHTMNAPSASTRTISRKMIHIPSCNMSGPWLTPAPILAATLLLAACNPVAPDRGPVNLSDGQSVCETAARQASAACAPCVCDKPPPPPARPQWQSIDWNNLPGWTRDTHAEVWRPFLASCTVLRRQPAWQAVCAEAESLPESQARVFFETRLKPWRRLDAAGNALPGMVTGYYEPLLNGSRTRKPPFVHPVFGVPDDLLTIDLGDLRPDLKGQRLRGRIDGRRVVPYFSREEIEAGRPALGGRELVYVDDPIDLFFLMIQGSGRVRLDNGQTVRLNYADQNGHPYRSIGRILIDRGDLKASEASMQGIKAWARANPSRLQELLNANPSYVFFREAGTTIGAGGNLPGPSGAQGVALTPGRSLAVDTGFIPLGSPVWLATTYPNTAQPLERLMLAQDTGGAIRGVNRADYFWGFGDDAGREAGRMRQSGEMWLLWPAGAGEPPR
jgi:membrane-bound lytic murein transglycosylase A